MTRSILTLGLLGMIAGCSFHARDGDSYRKATRELLETRSNDIKACYDAELQKDPQASGSVIVKFKVQAETGNIVEATVDPAASSAPASLGQCVVEKLEGLALDPPDARTGDASFSWEFQLRS
ncbi:MAG: AgmX/PglI C-terminal domain-containing protein [Myxococcales bacterium]|nr:AgmX/PglI C-terminal domain-containing protein [Myxococcales bacterium]